MKKQNKKAKLLVSVFFFFVVFSFSEKAIASTGFISNVSTNGSFNTSNAPTTGCRTTGTPPAVGNNEAYYKGTYPATSSPSAKIQGGPTADDCSGNSGNLETVFSGLGDGDYFLLLGATTGETDWSYYTTFERIGGLWYSGNGSSSSDTRIISVTPPNNTTINGGTPPYSATSTATVTVTVDIFFNDVSEGGYIDQVCVYLENMETNFQLVPICEPIIASGGSTLTFEFTDILHGRYFGVAAFSNGSFEHFFSSTWEFINIFTQVPNQSCLFGDEVNGTCQGSNPPYGYSSTTPTTNWGFELDDCSVYSTWDGDKAMCALLNGLKRITNAVFVPDNFVFSTFIGDLHDNVLTHFPIGYITDFVSIISTSTIGTLTVLSATVPNGVVGTGSHIELDMTGVLDQFLNATTGTFTNSTASSTETLFEITNRYWKYILYILTLLYMLRRILGATLIPHGAFGEHGALSDTSGGDDSYALKEKLYKMSKRK